MRVVPLSDKDEKLVIGLMSGTSADGVDAALVRIKGSYIDTKLEEAGFISVPYEESVRAELLRLAEGDKGGSAELMRMSFLLGELFLEAAKALCASSGVSPGDIDLIGSHGHTVFHQPDAAPYLGRSIRGTMQIGDVSALSSYFSCPVVSDFRVRDFAEGGMGAPLVPYTEFILYSDPEEDVAYQNLGGIGNITLLRAGSGPEDIIAFDTGPGNALLDALIGHYTGERYDEGGRLALEGRLSKPLQEFFLSDSYVSRKPPKTTGREYYGKDYAGKILRIAEEGRVRAEDVLSTTAWFTAYSIWKGLSFFPSFRPRRLIVSGGGSHNRAVMGYIEKLMADVEVIRNPSGDSKEAAAFAVLANEAISGNFNCLTGATGARKPSVLGKIQF